MLLSFRYWSKMQGSLTMRAPLLVVHVGRLQGLVPSPQVRPGALGV